MCIFLLSCALFQDVLNAQPKSVGSTFSYAGTALVYEHHTDDDSFAEIQLRMETAAVFTNRRFEPGITASFTWNTVFAEIKSRDGNEVVFFGGPGAIAGFAEDIGSRRGFMFGLKGRIGGECRFSRNIAVSLSISPVIGLHLGYQEGILNMLLYKTGLLYGIMPEVGVKYAF